jgi:hypothetical protein
MPGFGGVTSAVSAGVGGADQGRERRANALARAAAPLLRQLPPPAWLVQQPG